MNLWNRCLGRNMSCPPCYDLNIRVIFVSTNDVVGFPRCKMIYPRCVYSLQVNKWQILRRFIYNLNLISTLWIWVRMLRPEQSVLFHKSWRDFWSRFDILRQPYEGSTSEWALFVSNVNKSPGGEGQVCCPSIVTTLTKWRMLRPTTLFDINGKSIWNNRVLFGEWN